MVELSHLDLGIQELHSSLPETGQQDGEDRAEFEAAKCKSRLRQMAIDATSYAAGNNGMLPLAYKWDRTDMSRRSQKGMLPVEPR